jgi:hypothetical protein
MNAISDIGMIYNSQKDLLVLPEYGRNFQKMVNHCKTIEDPELRQAFAERLINLMGQMQPSYKNTIEYQQKLWNQLMMVAHYELEVEPPEGFVIRTQEERLNPDPLDYPGEDKKFRHYGNHVLTLINKAIEMEDGPKKSMFIKVIGSYMKLAYKSWNREHYVNDEIIKADILRISGGKIKIPDDIMLNFLRATSAPRPNAPSNTNRRRSRKSGGHQNRNKHKSRRKR